MRIRRVIQPAAAVLFLALALAFLSWPLLAPDRVVITDGIMVSDATCSGLPFRAMLHGALRGQGSLLWCPDIYCGFPLHGDPDAGFFYPLNWLMALLPDPIGSAHASQFVNLLLAAVGLLLLLRHERLGWLPSLVGALALASGGFFFSHFMHLGLLNTAAWMPWLFYAVSRLHAPGGVRSGFLLTALVTAAIGLAGHPQILHMSLLVAILFSLLQAVVPGVAVGRLWRGDHLRRLVILLLALGVGLLIAAANLLPAADMALRSERATQRGEEFSTRIELDPRNLQTWVAPGAVGRVGEGTYRGSGLFWEDYCYQGLLALPCFLLGAIVCRRSRRARIWVVLFLLALVLALGTRGGLYALLHHVVPGMQFFRFPARFLCIAQLAVAVLAAHGVAAIARGVRARLWRAAVAETVVVGLLLAWWVVDLRWAQRDINAFAPRARWVEPPATVDEVPAGYRYLSLGYREAHLIAYRMARGWLDVEPYVQHRAFLQPSMNLPFGVAAADGYGNPAPRNIVAMWGDHYAGGLLLRSYAVVDDRLRPTPLLFKLAQMGGVKTLFSLWPTDDPRAPPPRQRPPVLVYDMPEPLPHERFVPGAIWVDTIEEATTRVADLSISPRRQVVLRRDAHWSETDAAGHEAISAGAGAGRVSVLERRATALVCSVSTREPGYLVIQESHDPGWRAWVNGESTPVLEADVAFQAVPVAAGEHLVRLSYWPRRLRAGLGLSALGCIVLVAGAMRLGRRRDGRAGEPADAGPPMAGEPLTR